jgi:flagellar L-ring protein FlgH
MNIILLLSSFVFAAPTGVKVETGADGQLFDANKSRALLGMEGNSRGVGDLITIEISEKTSTKVMAGTQTQRDSRVNAGVNTFFGLESKITSLYPDIGGQIAMDVQNNSAFMGDGETSREGLLQGQLTCKVVEVRPNGNLVIFGWKEVRSNQEVQYLSLSGMVRPQDIGSNNVVLSHLIAEARIEYTGSGVVGDKQAPGFGTRVVDHVWPF